MKNADRTMPVVAVAFMATFEIELFLLEGRK